MELKKNKEKEILNKRPALLMLGLIISLSIVLSAFEWKVTDNADKFVFKPLPQEFDPLVEIPNTVHQPPPPPPIIQPKVVEVPNEVDLPQNLPTIIFEPTEQELMPKTELKEILPDEVPEEIFLIVEETASFSNDKMAWVKFLRKNLKYPRSAKRMGIEGKVQVSFVVDKEGSLSDIEVIRGIGGGCDEEAIRVLRLSPKWNPGRQRGNPVKSRMSMYIHFRLK